MLVSPNVDTQYIDADALTDPQLGLGRQFQLGNDQLAQRIIDQCPRPEHRQSVGCARCGIEPLSQSAHFAEQQSFRNPCGTFQRHTVPQQVG